MASLWLRILQYLSVRQQRQQLLTMDERMRKDLAISRVDAERYAGRYKTDEHFEPESRKKLWKK
jgi:uncharacterized protein YjiS (DUF1127 family)